MINIKQEPLLPLHVRIAGYGVAMAGVLLGIATIIKLLKGVNLSAAFYFFPLLILGGLIIATTHYRLLINVEQRNLKVITWILGFSVGKYVPFNSIVKVYINKVLESSTANSYAGRRHSFQREIYKAFIKLDNGEKIHLDSDKNEDRLNGRIEEYIQKFGEAYNPE